MKNATTSPTHGSPHKALELALRRLPRFAGGGGLRRALSGALLALGLLGAHGAAQAQFATGGSGLYRNSILWFSWGTHNQAIPAGGLTVTRNTTISGNTLAVTCSLSSITGTIVAYRSGSWQGDGLDDLYNIGGAGTSNTLVAGLQNPGNGGSATFNFACSATLGGVVFPLKGLVFADAEQQVGGSPPPEYVRVTVPGGSTMRVIDRFRSCTATGSVVRTADTYELNNEAGTCTGGTGPMGVFFLDGGTSGSVAFKGQGYSAVALGVMVHLGDFGDAPDSYGVVSHLINYPFTGGTVSPNTNTALFSISMATLSQPTTAVLGSRVDTEAASIFSANALGDDNNQSPDDEDGVNVAGLAPLHPGLAGTTYSVPVVCIGTSPIKGWIDFNRDGDFADPGEASTNTPNCASGAATLNWTVPNTVTAGASYLRVRTAEVASQIANPTGLAASGEVEDHRIPARPQLTLRKVVINDNGGTSTASDFNISSNAGTYTFSTAPVVSGNTSTYTSNTLFVATGTYTLTEDDLPGYTEGTWSCNSVAAGAYNAGSITLALDNVVVCQITNDDLPTADLSITKTNSVTTLSRGQSTTYTIVVTNNGPSPVTGAIVKDPAAPGLSCTTDPVCTGSACPALAANRTIGLLQGTGIVLGALGVGAPNAVTLSLTCTVQ